MTDLPEVVGAEAVPRRRWMVVAAATALLLVALGGAALASRDEGSPVATEPSPSSTITSTTSTPTTAMLPATPADQSLQLAPVWAAPPCDRSREACGDRPDGLGLGPLTDGRGLVSHAAAAPDGDSWSVVVDLSPTGKALLELLQRDCQPLNELCWAQEIAVLVHDDVVDLLDPTDAALDAARLPIRGEFTQTQAEALAAELETLAGLPPRLPEHTDEQRTAERFLADVVGVEAHVIHADPWSPNNTRSTRVFLLTDEGVALDATVFRRDSGSWQLEQLNAPGFGGGRGCDPGLTVSVPFAGTLTVRWVKATPDGPEPVGPPMVQPVEPGTFGPIHPPSGTDGQVLSLRAPDQGTRYSYTYGCSAPA